MRLGSSPTVWCSLDTAVSVGLGFFLFKKHSCNSTTSKAPYNSDILKALIQVASTFFFCNGNSVTLGGWRRLLTQLSTCPPFLLQQYDCTINCLVSNSLSVMLSKCDRKKIDFTFCLGILELYCHVPTCVPCHLSSMPLQVVLVSQTFRNQ